MKTQNSLKLLVFLLVLSLSVSLPARVAKSERLSTIPAVKVKTMDGKTVSTADFTNDGKPMIIDFWATWCSPCKKELNAIAAVYEDWQKETGVKVIAVSIDDSRNSPKVAPFVKGRDWPFEVYIDENSDFKRAMDVNEIPHTFILNGKGEVVAQHKSYAPGDENKLFEELKKVAEEGK